MILICPNIGKLLLILASSLVVRLQHRAISICFIGAVYKDLEFEIRLLIPETLGSVADSLIERRNSQVHSVHLTFS